MTELCYPTSELSDDTLVEDVRLSARIRNALKLAGIKTVVRETPEETLLSSRISGRVLRTLSLRQLP